MSAFSKLSTITSKLSWSQFNAPFYSVAETGGPTSETVSDAITVNDAVNERVIYMEAIADSLRLVDSVTETAGSVTSETIADAVTLSSQVNESIIHVETVADSLSLNDSVADISVASESVTDSMTLSDSVTEDTVAGGASVAFKTEQVHFAIGTADTTKDVTLSSNFDPNYTSVIYGGGVDNNDGSANTSEQRQYQCGLELVDQNTVRATRNLASSSLDYYATVVQWGDTLVESVQRATYTLGTGDSGAIDVDISTTLGLTDVDATRSCVVVTGIESDSSTPIRADTIWPTAVLKNGSTVTINREAGGTTTVLYLEIIQFKAAAITSIQNVEFTHADGGTATQTATISSASESDSILLFGGFRNDAGTSQSVHLTRVRQTSPTELSFTRSFLSGNPTWVWTVVEFANSVLTDRTEIDQTTGSIISLTSPNYPQDSTLMLWTGCTTTSSWPAWSNSALELSADDTVIVHFPPQNTGSTSSASGIAAAFTV